jgi:uncharacterized protein (DUF58 family)
MIEINGDKLRIKDHPIATIIIYLIATPGILLIVAGVLASLPFFGLAFVIGALFKAALGIESEEENSNSKVVIEDSEEVVGGSNEEEEK